LPRINLVSDNEKEPLDSHSSPTGSKDLLSTTLYHELHNLAAARLAKEQGPLSMQATALVHDAWIRMGGDKSSWANRAEFFAAAAKTMRRILVDRARRRRSLRHGGDQNRVELDAWNWENLESTTAGANDRALIALNDALDRFSEIDPSTTELIQLRYFGGVKVKEAAELTGLSERTTERRLAYARAWLARDIKYGSSR
jgi:RNA polymerase sigma factor (TIGR02999 family)